MYSMTNTNTHTHTILHVHVHVYTYQYLSIAVPEEVLVIPVYRQWERFSKCAAVGGKKSQQYNYVSVCSDR